MAREIDPSYGLNLPQADGFSWSGPISALYAARRAFFEKLLQHPEVRLRQVARIGFDHYSQCKAEALAREKRAEIRGELA